MIITLDQHISELKLALFGRPAEVPQPVRLMSLSLSLALRSRHHTVKSPHGDLIVTAEDCGRKRYTAIVDGNDFWLTNKEQAKNFLQGKPYEMYC